MTAQVDMDQVAVEAAQRLGSQMGLLTLEMTAQLAANAGHQARVSELEAEAATKGAELARAMATIDRLHGRVAELEELLEAVQHQRPVSDSDRDGEAPPQADT